MSRFNTDTFRSLNESIARVQNPQAALAEAMEYTAILEEVILSLCEELELDPQALAKDASLATGGAIGGGLVGGKIAQSSRNKFDEKKNRSGVEKSVQGLKEGAIKYGTAAAGALVAAGLSRFEKNLKADTSYRITDAIALYINDPPSVKYSAQYSNKDLGTLAGIVGGISGVDSLSGAGSLASESSAALLATFA